MLGLRAVKHEEERRERNLGGPAHSRCGHPGGWWWAGRRTRFGQDNPGLDRTRTSALVSSSGSMLAFPPWAEY